jgi:perosamine synthetase
MDDFIPLCVPSIRGNEWKYIKECLDTEWISSAGAYVDRFEKALCEYTRATHSVACVNGTAALHTALRVVGVKEGDEVIVPTVTFIAPVNAVNYLGGKPVFMDCDEYLNIDVEKTIDFLNKETVCRNGNVYNKHTSHRISAIIPVHIYGNAVRLNELIHVCREKNIKVVEDATETLGVFYNSPPLSGKHTGTVGDIGCLSFNGNKIITTGAGGMILTDSTKYAEHAKYLTTQAKDDEVMWIHNEMGYNYRLTNIQAALGVAQLEQLPKYLDIKRGNYQTYKNEIDKIPGLHLADPPEYATSNYWMYPVQIDKYIYGKDREGVMSHLADKKIQTRPVWYLNHQQKPYKDCQNYKIEMAYKMWEKTLNIPCSVNLKEDEIKRVIEGLKHG